MGPRHGIEVDVEGLSAGETTIDVNGVRAQFALTEDH
jgi:hypothetical protein